MDYLEIHYLLPAFFQQDFFCHFSNKATETFFTLQHMIVNATDDSFPRFICNCDRYDFTLIERKSQSDIRLPCKLWSRGNLILPEMPFYSFRIYRVYPNSVAIKAYSPDTFTEITKN